MLSYFFRRVSKINIYKQCKTRLDEDQCEVKGFQRIYDAPEADKEGANWAVRHFQDFSDSGHPGQSNFCSYAPFVFFDLGGADSWRVGYKDVALPEVVLPEDPQAGKFTCQACCTATAGVVDRKQAFSWLRFNGSCRSSCGIVARLATLLHIWGQTGFRPPCLTSWRMKWVGWPVAIPLLQDVRYSEELDIVSFMNSSEIECSNDFNDCGKMSSH